MMNLLKEYELAVAQLPVEPSDRQVLFVENHKNPELEQFLHRNYDRLVKMFGNFGLEFIYIPELTTRMDDSQFREIASYYCPWLQKEDLDSLHSAVEIRLEDLFSEVRCQDDKPATVNSRGRAFKIDVSKPQLFDALFYQIAEAYGKREMPEMPAIRFSKVSRSKSLSDIAPVGRITVDYDIEACSMSSEECLELELIRKRKRPEQDFESEPDPEVERLFDQARKTLPGWLLKEALKKILQKEEVVSTLVITQQGKLFLPDYQNIEIKLTPKAKAVYFLFLKHPEGIFFKDLPDYRDELLRYYKKVAKSDSPEAIEAAIDYLIDILSGDADTQRSRIKSAINAAFTKQFCEQYARYYTIEGTKGQAMKVELPRSKVIWQLDI